MKYFRSIFVGMLAILLGGCVAPFGEEIVADSLPLISGVISNSSSQREIQISRTDGFQLTPLPLIASGSIFKDGALAGTLIRVDTGLLRLPDEVLIEAGHSYHIEMETAEGERFVSRPQLVQPLPAGPAQRLSWERGVERDQGANAVPRNVVNVFAEIETTPEEIRYYRWETAETWMHREVPRPERVTILQIDSTRDVLTGEWIYDTTEILLTDPLQICYPSREIEEFPSLALSTADLQDQGARILVHQTEIGQSFLFQHYFRIYLHPITYEAYEYYRKSQRLVDISGELYDEIPAAVNGNLINPEDSTARVLGFVEFSLVDSAYISLNQDDLGIALTNACDNGSPFGPCGNTGGGPPQPCKCFDCDLVYGAETLIKPHWWED